MFEAYATQAEAIGWIVLLAIMLVGLSAAFVASKINPAYIKHRKRMRMEKRRGEDWWE